MRKRKGKFVKHTVVKTETKQYKTSNKKVQTIMMLVGICFLVLFLNSYFNYTSGTVFNPDGETLGERFFLSGPDPYLNMRHVEQTLIQGRYPYTAPHSGDFDPLLNYPVGSRGARPPLFNMMAVGSAVVLQNFMSTVDALGWSMLFLPAIYGALLIFPVYGIGKELFNRKVGLMAALLIAITPIHIGGSHGSILSLFDHDSFLLLLFTCIFYFMIKSLKAQTKNESLLYGMLTGVFVGAVYLTWSASQFIFTVLLLTLMILVFFDIVKSKYSPHLYMSYNVMFGTALFISLPWILVHQDELIGFPVICFGVSIFLGLLLYVFHRFKTPWIISLPIFGGIGCIGTGILYLMHIGVLPFIIALYQLTSTFFGIGIYGSKVSMTVAEARNFGLSQSVMSFGPAIYWLALAGFILFIIKTRNEKWQAQNIFFITIFIVVLWLSTTAGRFLNDLVPTMAIFSAFTLFLVIEKINYKQMLRNMKNLEFLGKRKAVHYMHVFGIVIILFLVILPNSFMALDAAVPAETKYRIFGEEHRGAFGNSNSKTMMWADAFGWLNDQDTEFENDADKPAFISWWDYGFYEAAIGHHPTVADNYQVGLYAAGNFKLAKSEQEAVSVLIIRCIEGNKVQNDDRITEEVKDVIRKYLPTNEYNSSIISNVVEPILTEPVISNYTVVEKPWEDFISYIEDPTLAPSYDELVTPEYGNTVLRKRVDNVMYQDCWTLMQNLTDVEITNFYKDIQEVTGYSIRYYGTEQYDTQIFGVFTFLTDRGTQGFVTEEDDYYITLYEDRNSGYKWERWQIEQWTEDKFEGKDLVPVTERKQAFYETLWYKTYYGYGEFPDNRLPTYNLRHFKLAYYSPYVVISKYYEGATVNGTVTLEGQPYPETVVYVMDEYGIPHDSCMVDNNGNFSLITPAGALSFKVFVSEELQDLQYTNYLNITEDEGRQIVPCNKTTSFDIKYANININVDSELTNLTLNIKGKSYQNVYSYPFELNYAFNLTELIPDNYLITVTNLTGSVLYNETIYIRPGENIKDVTVQN